eukprot:scaffold3609_cov196-Alexandrium_tamarense.AAC.2
MRNSIILTICLSMTILFERDLLITEATNPMGMSVDSEERSSQKDVRAESDLSKDTPMSHLQSGLSLMFPLSVIVCLKLFPCSVHNQTVIVATMI